MRMVVLQFRGKLPGSGTDDGRSRRSVELGNGPAVVRQIRASYAAKVKRKRAKLGNEAFLNEVFLKMKGVLHYLWRAMDQHGAVIDILVQPKRDRFAALRFFHKLIATGYPLPASP